MQDLIIISAGAVMLMVFMVSTGAGKCCHVRLAQAAQPVQLVWRGIRFRPERNLFMKETKLFKRKTWHLIITGILALTTLGLSLTLIRTIFDSNAGVEEVSAIVIDYSAIQPIAVLLFMLLAVVHLVQYVISDTKPRLLLIRELIYVLFSLGAAFIILLRGGTPAAWTVACAVFFLAVFIGCILSLLQKRSKWNIFLLVISLILLVFGAVPMLLAWTGEPETVIYGVLLSIITLFFLVDTQGVASIVPIAFTSIRMDILKRIIRKTYALEILSGIVLLIIAFSFILTAFEDNITTFGDALWYCFAIVTTIGFGDLTATSIVGRIMSVILGIYGIIVVALITSIIVNFYGEMKKEEDDNDQDGYDDSPVEGGQV
jgi:hypothetical protein